MKIVEEQYEVVTKKIKERLTDRLPEITEHQLENVINLLLDVEVVNNNTDIIDVGSKFNLTLYQDGYKYGKRDYIISECSEPVEGYMVIQPNCPLARAVIGKTEKENANYIVETHDLRAIINKIYKSKVKTMK